MGRNLLLGNGFVMAPLDPPALGRPLLGPVLCAVVELFSTDPYVIFRTIYATALTVFLAALALFIWGGEVLRDFSFAMLIGVGFGTYSSVYVASALALDIWILLDRRKGVQAE